MFMALRPQKWRMASRTTAGHAGFTQRSATSPGSRTAGSPQTGQRLGMTYGGASEGRFSSTTRTTLGMTSPPFSTMTVSPTRTSFRARSS